MSRKDKVKRYVYSRFPELKGVQPTISASRGSHTYTFKKRLSMDGGAELLEVVRVTADDQGEILKVSVSK